MNANVVSKMKDEMRHDNHNTFIIKYINLLTEKGMKKMLSFDVTKTPPDRLNNDYDTGSIFDTDKSIQKQALQALPQNAC